MRALDAGGGLWLIVSAVNPAEYSEKAIAAGLQQLDWVSRRALRHESVVERFLAAAALLPMQLFTIFTSDERALAHVARERRKIDRLLDRMAGNVEWGLRLIWDEQAARATVEAAHQPASSAARRTGADYLVRKRDLLDVSRTRLAEVRAVATSLHRELATEARDAVRRTATEQAAPGSRLLLDAAYLVPSRRAAAFRGVIRRRRRRLADAGISATLTGPWPPYNFVPSR